MSEHKMEIIAVNVSNVNWRLLRKQKATLTNIRAKNIEQWDDIAGILHLLDHIQDHAAKQLGERRVFGKAG